MIILQLFYVLLYFWALGPLQVAGIENNSGFEMYDDLAKKEGSFVSLTLHQGKPDLLHSLGGNVIEAVEVDGCGIDTPCLG
jgi:hypothetical protein